MLQLNQLELTGSYEYISTDLRWLCWRESHLEAIPSKLDMENLVAIDMSSSKLKVLPSLKILNLKDSDKLVKIANVSLVPNLETLNLWNCHRLVRVCDTLRSHKCLTLLNIIGCENLCKREQPRQISLFGGRNKKQTSFPLPCSLKQLFLKDCIHEENDYFPITFKGQARLEYLNLVNSPFELLPNYSHLENLRVLDVSGCGGLKMLLRLPSKLAELYVYHFEHLFKLVPVAKLTETDLKHMKWLREYQDLKMLYELITSISMPDIEKPNMIPEYEYTSDNDSLSFQMLSCPKNKRLKGLNMKKIHISVHHEGEGDVDECPNIDLGKTNQSRLLEIIKECCQFPVETIVAAEAAIGLAIVSSIYRNRKSTRINQANLLNKPENVDEELDEEIKEIELEDISEYVGPENVGEDDVVIAHV
ncbi:TMV resistance protein N-like protein, partial [Tanacetum coccineum]